MRVIAGLGNPGKRYAETRHNVGFRVVDRLAEVQGARFRRSLRYPARTCKAVIGGAGVLLVKPWTFMNRSGGAVAPALRKAGGDVEDLIIVFDDADLEPGRVRIRKKGGAGGHNGMRSILDALGREDFVRVRVGIGRAERGEDMVSYVLGRFDAKQRPPIDDAVNRAAEAVECILRDGSDEAMNIFNAGTNESRRQD